jgi:UDP-N-acetylmuramate dehydrogenase
MIRAESRSERMIEARGLRGELRRREPMARHTSWRTGGVADYAYAAADREDLRAFLAALPVNEPVYVVGLGSNLLVRDGGLRGTVLLTHGVLDKIALEDGAIRAEAGVPSPKFARFAATHARAGAEFMAGIPGTVGGALAMNAGCYGGETWNIVESVTTLSRSGELTERPHADYTIGYRSVALKHGGKRPSFVQPPLEECFIAARFRLAPGDRAHSRALIKQLLETRGAAQPLKWPNAGSVFRNPSGDHAARLIEACGLKGHARGGAVISDKHANFIVNLGHASAADIEALIGIAHNAVKHQFGIELEREVRIVGEHA